MAKKNHTVGVIGAGSWGTTISHLLGLNHHKVMLWARNKDIVDEVNNDHTNTKYLPEFELNKKIIATDDLAALCHQCKVIFLVVPSKGFRQVANEAGNYLTGDKIVIHATKGLEKNTRSRMSEILKEETCCKKIGVLSGPNLAVELMRGEPAGTVIASKFDEVVMRGQELLHGPILRVYGSHDVIGVEMGGVLKNIFAIASGMLNGKGFGNNTKSTLMTRGLSEIIKLSLPLGAKGETFGGLSGIGDLITTCASPLSRNYQVGLRMAGGETLADIQKKMFMVAEGVNTTTVAHDLAAKLDLDVPIIEGVYEMLFHDKPFTEVLKDLMQKEIGYENEIYLH